MNIIFVIFVLKIFCPAADSQTLTNGDRSCDNLLSCFTIFNLFEATPEHVCQQLKLSSECFRMFASQCPDRVNTSNNTNDSTHQNVNLETLLVRNDQFINDSCPNGTMRNSAYKATVKCYNDVGKRNRAKNHQATHNNQEDCFGQHIQPDYVNQHLSFDPSTDKLKSWCCHMNEYQKCVFESFLPACKEFGAGFAVNIGATVAGPLTELACFDYVMEPNLCHAQHPITSSRPLDVQLDQPVNATTTTTESTTVVWSRGCRPFGWLSGFLVDSVVLILLMGVILV